MGAKRTVITITTTTSTKRPAPKTFGGRPGVWVNRFWEELPPWQKISWIVLLIIFISTMCVAFNVNASFMNQLLDGSSR